MDHGAGHEGQLRLGVISPDRLPVEFDVQTLQAPDPHVTVLVEIVLGLVQGVSPGVRGVELESAAMALGPAALGAHPAVRGWVAVEDAVATHAYAHLYRQVGELVGEVGAVVSAVGHDPDRLVALSPPSQGHEPGDDLTQLVGGALLN